MAFTAPQHLRLIATCQSGLEHVVANELVALGAGSVDAGYGSVSFLGDLAGVCRANLWLRSAVRVLVELDRGPAPDRRALYELAARVPWQEVVGPGQTIAVTATGRSPGFDNSGYAALVVKDAVVDRVRASRGFRPDVDRDTPDVRIVVHLDPIDAVVALDSSGEPLGHRGYRPAGGPAPVSEALAAGILLLAGYDGSRPLLDPMCGTGTIAIEAALIATRTAPGLARRFAFERWAFVPSDVLPHFRAEATAARCKAPRAIIARDLNARAVQAATRNVAAARVDDSVHVEIGDATALTLGEPGWMIVSNPPYGRRLGEGADLASLYQQLGDALKRGASGSNAWLLVGDAQLVKAIGLRPRRRLVLFNGPIECRLLHLELYAGSRRGATGHAGVDGC